MTESEFMGQVAALRRLSYREDFQTALCDLYVACMPTQCEALRKAMASGNLKSPPQWKNPADYDRTDLTREQKMRQSLVAMSLHEHSNDYRDDLMGIAFSYHNLRLMGVDADDFLEHLAARSGPTMEAAFLNFTRRASEGKSPESFGLRIVQSAGGPIAERFL